MIKKVLLATRAEIVEMETDNKSVNAPALYLFTKRNTEAINVMAKTASGSSIAFKFEKNGTNIPTPEIKNLYVCWSTDGKNTPYLTKKATNKKAASENKEIKTIFFCFKKLLTNNILHKIVSNVLTLSFLIF